METSAPTLRRSEALLRRTSSALRPYQTALLAAVGIALIFWAQFDLSARDFSLKTLVLLIVGASLTVGSAFAAGYRALGADEQEASPAARAAPRDWPRWRLLALPGAAVFTLMAYSLSEFDRFSIQGVIVWALAIVLFFAAWWQPTESATPSLWTKLCRYVAEARRQPLLPALSLGAFLLVGALAVFFRFHSLNGLPADATSLEADVAENVRGVLNGHSYVYMPSGVGEGAMVYATAGLVKLFGFSLDYSAMKVATAVVGVLAVGATYLLLTEFFANRLVALIGALFMAVAHWPVTLSRSSLSSASAPLLAALTLLFLVRALKHNRTNDFLLCGLAAGLGLYFYEGLRVLPFLIVACLALKFVAVLLSRRKREVFPLVGRSTLLGLMLLIVFAPMARAWYDQPDYYLRNVDSHLTGSEPRGYSGPTRLAGNVKNAFLMFAWQGDSAYRANIPGDPALDEGMAALLALGIAVAAVAWVRYRRGMFLYAAVALVALLMPSALSLAVPSENPSLARASGAIPLTFGFAALPVAFVISAATRHLSRRTGLAVMSVSVIGLAACFAVANYHWYFQDYSDTYRQAAPSSATVSNAIAVTKRENPAIDVVYLVAPPNWNDPPGIAMMLGQPTWLHSIFPLPETIGAPQAGRSDLYVLPDEDETSLNRLKQVFPQGISDWHHLDNSGKSFLLFTTSPPP